MPSFSDWVSIPEGYCLWHMVKNKQPLSTRCSRGQRQKRTNPEDHLCGIVSMRKGPCYLGKWFGWTRPNILWHCEILVMDQSRFCKPIPRLGHGQRYSAGRNLALMEEEKAEMLYRYEFKIERGSTRNRICILYFALEVTHKSLYTLSTTKHADFAVPASARLQIFPLPWRMLMILWQYRQVVVNRLYQHECVT